MTKYIYFVSYAHNTGFGNMEVSVQKEVTTYDFITIMEQKITEWKKVDKVVLLSYQLLRIEECELMEV